MSQKSSADSLWAAIGPEVFDRMVAGFYQRVRVDDVLGPMYPDDDWEGAEFRLRTFLEQYWGGPRTYGELRGHPRLRMRHMPFVIDSVARQRWLDLMAASLAEISDEDLPEEYRTAVWNHMVQVADMVINHFDEA
ncbi:globin [Corynebacterium ulceribovis]|uniref:globin domain-containing protein n=1 Tax=Corynebacterium ulceribovis TaxID=487732 RepID=UPI00036581EF|nr:globin [Corynebacterium ulceribovis]